ncbi:MAG: SPOR domain-containing protein [Candidatus Zixiibacteriota bacterium]
MNIIRFGILIIVLLMAAAGCRGTFDRPDETRPKDDGEGLAIPQDPMSLPSDYDVVPEKYPIMASVDDSSTGAISKDSSGKAAPGDSLAGLLEVYRIQLFTSNTYGPAAREAGIAREVFDREVRLDYEVPYYKVRIGDFAYREDAESYLPAAIEAGYSNAWVVKVTINVQNVEETYDEDIPPLTDSLEVYPEDTESKNE